MAAVTQGVQVLGARELRSSMRRAEISLQDLKEAHAAAARLAAAKAVTKAPRVSGALASNVRGSGAAGAATIRVGGAKVPYAQPIHWGWPARGIPANPFVSEGAQETEPEWFNGIYLPAVERILNQVEGI